MNTNRDGPVNLGFKLSLQDSFNVVYNFDIAKSKHLLYGGFCVGLFPFHVGCLSALDTTRNCMDREETKLTTGFLTFPGKTKPWSAPPSFPVFHFLGVQRRRPGAEISITASKKLTDKNNAGFAVGFDARDGGEVSLAGFASYDLDEETTASVYLNRHLSTGFAVTRQLNAYHSISLLALVDLGRGLRLGLDVDYRPEPPLMVQIKYKIKEWKRDVGGVTSDPDILAMQDKLEEEARKTLGAAKKTLEEARNTWNELLNRN